MVKLSDIYRLIGNYLEMHGDKEVTSIATWCISSECAYTINLSGGDGDIPIFIFGGAAEWYQETFGRSSDEGLKERKPEVAEALGSFMYGHFEDRRMYEAALAAIMEPEKKEQFKAAWQNGRSSLNDIGTYAHKMAKRLLN